MRKIILEQANALIKIHMVENQIFVRTFVTTELLQSADTSEKKNRKILTSTDAT